MEQLITRPHAAADARQQGESEAGDEYIWRFGDVLFDEGRWELRVGDTVVETEPKPLEMLGLLLRHSGEVVTKEEMLAFLWPGVIVVEKALTNAVSKLRRAIGDTEQSVIVTVHRIGYRFMAPATRKAIPHSEGAKLKLRAGDKIAGRPQWRLERLLANAEGSEVWLASHEKTRKQRVFKFAYSGHRLAALKREATLTRVLTQLLGPHPGIISLHEWNFEEPPFFLECAYGGLNWLEWAEAGHLAAMSRQERIQLVLQAARAVAAAHSVGVLHKDLKPANLLIEPDETLVWRARLADFGCGRMLDPRQLEALGLTRLGVTMPAIGEHQSGTLMYMPPEVLAGHLPMPSADVYALGILLYQVLAGDLRKPLSTGWDHDIDDPLLREDIAAATHGDPLRRLSSAMELVTRLETLAQRREQLAGQQQASLEAARLRRELDLARARKPWVAGLAVSVVIGAVIGSIYLHRAEQAERAAQAAGMTAETERQRAEVINRFLVNDLLTAADPVLSGKRDVTVIEAVRKSAGEIDKRLAGQPREAAIVHMTAARAFGHIGAGDEAVGEYARAAQLLHGLGAAGATEATAADILQVICMVDAGQVKPATARLAQIESALSAAPAGSDENRKLLDFVRGKLALQSGDYPAARQYYERALAQAMATPKGAAALPQEDLELLASLRKDYAFTLEQTGDAVRAVGLMQDRLSADQAALGPEHTQVLIDKLELAEAMDTEPTPDPAGETLIEEVLPGLDRSLGPDNIYKTQALDELGSWAMNHHDWSRAASVFGQAYDLALRLHGTQDPHAMTEAFNLGYVLERSGRHGEARSRLESALQQAQADLGAATPMAQVIAYMLANANLALGRNAEARSAAHGLNAAALDSVEPGNDWPGRLNLLGTELAYVEAPSETRRQQLDAALAAIKASQDDDRDYLYAEGAALAGEATAPAANVTNVTTARS